MTERKTLVFYCFTLLFLYIGTPFFAYASPTEIYNPKQAFYNDKSWHGGWRFSQLILTFGAKVTRHQDSIVISEESKGEVIVLIEPRATDFNKNDLYAGISNGYRFIIFDTSEASIDWLNEIHPKLRLSHGQDPSAAYINANPKLPVLKTGAELGQSLSGKRLAFNHPMALAGGDAFIGNKDYGYAFVFPQITFQDLKGSSEGFALIFRDQSLVSSLMLERLDNRFFFIEILPLLCPKTGPCRVHLFEPKMAASFETKQDGLDSIAKRLKARLIEFKVQAEQSYRQNQEAIESFPWRAIGIAFLLFWTLVAVLLAYPLTRD